MLTEDGAALDTKQKEVCSPNYVGQPDIGVVLFPGRNRVSWASASRTIPREVSPSPYTHKVEAYMVGCIGYRDQFGFLYRTGFIYRLVDSKTIRAIEFEPKPNITVPGTWMTHDSFVELFHGQSF